MQINHVCSLLLEPFDEVIDGLELAAFVDYLGLLGSQLRVLLGQILDH
jgi:hypothetical protein